MDKPARTKPKKGDERKKMTKGQTEAKLSEVITKFEADYMARGPKSIKTKIIDDTVLIRQIGFLTLAEQMLSKTTEGTDLIKKIRFRLFETVIEQFKEAVNQVIKSKIISIHSDVSTKTGEKVIVVTFEENLEGKFN